MVVRRPELSEREREKPASRRFLVDSIRIEPGCLGYGEQVRLNRGIDDGISCLYALLYMKVMTDTAVRENLANTMDAVCDEHDPVVITRNRDQAVVLIPLEDYEALEETAYLLRSPANARRLLSSIANAKKGKEVIKTALGRP